MSRVSFDPMFTVHEAQRIVRQRDRGTTVGENLLSNLCERLAKSLQAIGLLDQKGSGTAQPILRHFITLLHNGRADSPAWERLEREIDAALNPPRPWREVLREEIDHRSRQWSHWLACEVSPKDRERLRKKTPEAMLECLQIKRVLQEDTLNLDTADEPPEITAALVLDVMHEINFQVDTALPVTKGNRRTS